MPSKVVSYTIYIALATPTFLAQSRGSVCGMIVMSHLQNPLQLACKGVGEMALVNLQAEPLSCELAIGSGYTVPKV